MSIVQVSDFKGEINIANTSDMFVAQNVQWFIDKYEPIYFTQLLGADLYLLLKNGLLEDPILTKWTELVANIKGAANFIYCKYIKNEFSQTVGTGEVKTKGANSYPYNPNVKIARAWNEMLDYSLESIKYINDNPVDYGGYYIENFYYMEWYNTYCDRPEIFKRMNTFGL